MLLSCRSAGLYELRGCGALGGFWATRKALCASLLYSSTVCVHNPTFGIIVSILFCTHSHCVPALVTCISIASGGFLDCSRLRLGCSTFWEAFWTALDCFWAQFTARCVLTLFSAYTNKKALRTSLLYSSTVCVLFHCKPALSLCTLLLYSSTVCVL